MPYILQIVPACTSGKSFEALRVTPRPNAFDQEDRSLTSVTYRGHVSESRYNAGNLIDPGMFYDYAGTRPIHIDWYFIPCVSSLTGNLAFLSLTMSGIVLGMFCALR